MKKIKTYIINSSGNHRGGLFYSNRSIGQTLCGIWGDEPFVRIDQSNTKYSYHAKAN
jgi:hypothetical protein